MVPGKSTPGAAKSSSLPSLSYQFTVSIQDTRDPLLRGTSGYVSARDLTCDKVGGLSGGRFAELRFLADGWPDLHTNRGCRVARCRMSGR